jgi:hypothetical protein
MFGLESNDLSLMAGVIIGYSKDLPIHLMISK